MSQTRCTFLDIAVALLSTEMKAATVQCPGKAADFLEFGLSRLLGIFRHLMKLEKQATLLWLIQLSPMLQWAGLCSVGRLCSVSLHSLWGCKRPGRLILANWERLEESASGLGFPSGLSHDALSNKDTHSAQPSECLV